MKKGIAEILSKYLDTIEANDALSEIIVLVEKNTPIGYSEHELDFAYLAGVFNTSGIDGLHNEIIRLKELCKDPHDIILSLRK